MELVVGATERPLLIEQARLLVEELEARHVTGPIFAETPEAVVARRGPGRGRPAMAPRRGRG